MRHFSHRFNEENHKMIKKLTGLLQSVLRPISPCDLEQFILAHRPQSIYDVEILQRQHHQYCTQKGLKNG